MRIRFQIRIVVTIAIAFLLPSVCCGQKITIAALDGESGKPLEHITIFLSISDQELHELRGAFHSTILAQGETSADGTVEFSLPPEVPKMLITAPDWGSHGMIGCKDLRKSLFFDTAIVLKAGVVSDDSNCDPTGKLTSKFTATSGKIVLFARKITTWERLKRLLIGTP
jgi:hypothetical protein